MRDGFHVSGACGRQPAGLQPVPDRLLPKPRFAEVAGDQLRLSLNNLREPHFDGDGYACVQVLPAFPEQAFISRVSYHRVLEHVSDRWGNAAAEDKLCSD
jgi:hypothetical protein